MKTDTVLRLEALDALVERLGEVDAERFLQMVKKDTFDYTLWREGLWAGKNVNEIHQMATAHERQSRK